MKVKVSGASGHVLDWMVAKAKDPDAVALDLSDPRDPWIERNGIADQPLHSYTPSTDWAQGGPIIEREGITVGDAGGSWAAGKPLADDFFASFVTYGSTPLIAVMRCFVASKLGEEVEVPEELS